MTLTLLGNLKPAPFPSWPGREMKQGNGGRAQSRYTGAKHRMTHLCLRRGFGGRKKRDRFAVQGPCSRRAGGRCPASWGREGGEAVAETPNCENLPIPYHLSLPTGDLWRHVLELPCLNAVVGCTEAS